MLNNTTLVLEKFTKQAYMKQKEDCRRHSSAILQGELP
jgi:hypothetical protein